MFPAHRDIIFADWLFDDNWRFDDDEEEIRPERRVYRMPVRNDINYWDDTDFVMRFRLSKPTFLYCLQLIAPTTTANNRQFHDDRRMQVFRYFHLENKEQQQTTQNKHK